MSKVNSLLLLILLTFFTLTSCRQSETTEIPLPTAAVTSAAPTVNPSPTPLQPTIPPTPTSRPTATATYAPPPTPIVSLPTATLPPISSNPFLTFDQPVVGYIDDQTVQKWYFSATAGETIDLSAHSLENGLDLVLDIHNQQGDSILPQAVDQSYTHEKINQLSIPNDGRYTILVYTFVNNKGKYQLLLQKGSITTEQNLFITLNDIYTQTLQPESTQDYLFIPEDNTPVSIVVTSLITGFDPLIKLYYQNAELIHQDINFDEIETVNFLPDANQAYLIQVADFSGNGGLYTISIKPDEETVGQLKEAGSLFKQTLFLQPEETISFQFRNLKGKELIAILSGPTNQIGSLSLFAPNLITTTIKNEIDQLYFTHPLNTSQNYTITLKNNGQTASSFELSLLFPQETVPYLLINQTVHALLPSNSSLSYLFVSTEASLIELTGYPTPNLDLVIRIYNQTNPNYPFAETDETFAGEPEQIRFYAEANESYLIEMGSFGESNGRFRFLLTQP